MSGINIRTWSQRKRYSVIIVFVALASVIQLLTPLVASADPAPVTTKVTSMSLPDQIKTYKMYYSLSVCMNKESQPTSNSDVAAGDWFSNDTARNTGSLVDQGGDDGNVHCNSILQEATSLWGITDMPGFLKSAGWTYYSQKPGTCNGASCNYGPAPAPIISDCTPSPSTTCDGLRPPKNGKDTKFQIAATKLLKGYVPAYPIYYGYYDNMATYMGICGATPVSKADQAAGGYSNIYIADPSKGTVTEQAYTTVYKSIAFGAAAGLTSAYGNAVNPDGYTYDDKTIDCSQIAKQLGKSQAQAYISALPASLKSTKTPTGNGGSSGQGSSDSGSTCGITGIGWIICPVMTFLANLNDQAFGVLNNFLEVKSNLTTSPNLIASWSAFRNIANVMFVIAFLVVIYSQITGMGVSNYGIKKLLPRIIAVAILVNISLILCQIAVDLSNVVGASIYDLFKGMPSIMGHTPQNLSTWGTVMGYVIEGAVGVALLIAVILAPMALLAVAVALLLLIARQALIVILIVISPLAFVAYLLPNTSSYFKKWWKIFSSMLMLYPIVGAIFGGSTLASEIISGASNTASGVDKWIMPLTALGVMALPLFLIPTTLKNSFNSLGSIGAKLAAIQSGANKRSKTAIKESRLGEMKAAHDRNKLLNKMRARSGKGGRMTRIGQSKLAQRAGVGKALERADITKLGVKLDNSKIGEKYRLNRGAADAAAQVAEAYDKDVKSDRTRMLIENEHHDILKAALSGEIVIRDENGKVALNTDGTEKVRKLSHTELDAAIQYTMDTGNALEREELLTHAGDKSWDRDHRHSAEQGVRKKGDTGLWGSGTLGAFGANSEDIAGKSPEEVEDFLKKGIIGRAASGALPVQDALRDGHTMKYVRDALVNPPKPKVVPAGASPEVAKRINDENAAAARLADQARTRFRAAIEEVRARNPQAWANVGQDVKDMVDGLDKVALDDDGNPKLDGKGRHVNDQFGNEGKSIGVVPPRT